MENVFQTTVDWLSTLEWQRLLPELIGKALGFLAGFAASWFLLFRRRLNAIQRMQSGDSDDFLFQMHRLVAHDDAGPEQHVLIFRNIAPKTTLNQLYDNESVREELKKAAEACTLDEPILTTAGTVGFELLNDALGHIAGILAITSVPREPWLFVMTCEDRQVVRKKCVRCFLIRPGELERFVDWDWCSGNVMVEKPWHWFRVVALHRIALVWKSEQAISALTTEASREKDMPLVDKQVRHDRVRVISVGIHSDDKPIGPPHRIDWSSHLPGLQKLGLRLTQPLPRLTPEVDNGE